ncbi:hypothetical protein JCM8202v2_006103 [Rhodotorula sphaerocarpa]
MATTAPESPSAAPPAVVDSAESDLPTSPGMALPESVHSPHTLVRRGWCTVKHPTAPGAVHRLYYELHGDDHPNSHRVVLTMGLNNSSAAWHEQVAYLATLPRYAVLVFDNRGVGWSDSPGWAYTTREMALDLVALLDHLDWTRDRSLNVVGVSMGGMIAQQLALLIPRRIRALLLTSTRSGSRTDWPSYRALNMFVRLTSGTVRTPERQIRLVVETLFPQAYLDQVIRPEDGEDPEWVGKTQRERVEAVRHSLTPEEAAKISTEIPRIAIIHGTEDNLLHVDRGRELHQELPGSTLKIVENAGHALPSQIRDEYHAWIREVVESESE